MKLHSSRGLTSFSRRSGFTLIELLVVIAIIGVLSAVVLASLNTARSKGSDAAIQSDLQAIKTQAEVFYGETGNSYGTAVANNSCAATAGTLFAEKTIAQAIAGADTANGTGSITCNSTAKAYAVQAQLVNDDTKYWCIDSVGSSKEESVAMVAGAVACL